MTLIQVTQSSMPDFEEYTKEIKDLWDSKWLTNMGSKHEELENRLEHYLNTSYITLFTNGHNALEAVINAYNLSGEVITTPFTFASTAHAIVRNNLTPVFCDINDQDYTINVDNLEGLITEHTSAIIPVHVYGNICDVYEIERTAKKYNLKVIYDAAHTFGVRVNGESIANFGDASMFSFHATKVFNTIEGGAVTYQDSDLKERLNALKNFGMDSSGDVEYIGGNAKMNEFQAAMGLCNLRNVDEEIKKRKKVAERYFDNLEGIDGINLSPIQEGVTSNYAYFPVLFDNYKLTRDEIFELLEESNIFSRKYFYPLVTDFPVYKEQYKSNETPVAEWTADRILTLPLYADLCLDDVDRICRIIKQGREEVN